MRSLLKNTLIVAGTLFVLSWSATALAAKGGGKPGGGGGAGDPPAAVEIVYTKPGSSGYDLRLAAPDGSNDSLLLAAAGDSLMMPAWSPDDAQVVFNGTVSGAGLYVIDADGTDLTRIYAGGARSPTWSPDGSRIAFAVDSGGARYDIWLIAPDGTGLTQVTSTTTKSEEYPSWSPDSGSLALSVGDFSTGRRDICVLDLSGGSTVNLTDVTGSPVRDMVLELTHADWSRDGTLIAFEARDLGAKWDIWAVPVASPANAANLTNTSRVSERRASWSPDGNEIVYMDAGSSASVVVFDLATKKTTRLARSGAGWPDWQR